MANIMDNLIGSGQVQPMVVVMPNGSGFANSTFNEAYDRDMIDRMIPYIEAHYHVSHSAMDRAFSGLSMGGMLTNSFIINHPDAFQYYGMMSAGLPPENAVLTPAQIAALKGKVIWVGGGWQDVIHAVGFSPNGPPTHLGPAREVETFAKAGVPVTTNFVNGGHEWSVWRQLLKDFLIRSAFLPHPYAQWAQGG
jgi:enterochelin esterase-like enzyme